MACSNLFEIQPFSGQAELFETLLQSGNVTIERIQSPAQTRSQIFLQEQDEWVCLLQGEATLEVNNEPLTLRGGEMLYLPSKTPHRVLDTSSDPLCIWLAVHIHPTVK